MCIAFLIKTLFRDIVPCSHEFPFIHYLVSYEYWENIDFTSFWWVFLVDVPWNWIQNRTKECSEFLLNSLAFWQLATWFRSGHQNRNERIMEKFKHAIKRRQRHLCDSGRTKVHGDQLSLTETSTWVVLCVFFSGWAVENKHLLCVAIIHCSIPISVKFDKKIICAREIINKTPPNNYQRINRVQEINQKMW